MDKGTAANKTLIMISQRYPYGHGEVYLERELKYFLEEFDQIILFPLGKTETARKLPEGVILDPFFTKRTGKVNKKYYLKNFRRANRILRNEYRNTNAKKYFKENRLSFLKELLQVFELAEEFEKRYLSQNKNFSFYSVWMDEGALMFSLLKMKGVIKNFSLRLHGYDLYDDRREGQYMPWRYTCFSQAKYVFMVSAAGKSYLEEVGLFVEKLHVNYSGLYDHGINESDRSNGVFTLVSCSNVIPLKRIDRIISSLAGVKEDLRWIHIGDGPDFEQIKKMSSDLPANITAEFKGRISFDEIMNLYKNERIHAFIHLSETEGLPLSIVEAMSFGIPAIATDVGGVSEIVNQTNGFLIEAEFEDEQIREIICGLMRDDEKLENLSNSARDHYLKNFSAEVNYRNFTKMILE